MSRKLKYTLTIAGFLLLWSVSYLFSVGGPVFYINWLRIDNGSSEEEVFELLGSPLKKETKFNFWVHEKNEEHAAATGAVKYASWLQGIDTLFLIGFNENNKVVYKIFGGS